MNEPTEPVLSEAGRARRDEILGVLHGAMAGRVRRRRIVRGLAVMAFAGAGVWATVQLRPAKAPAPAPLPVAVHEQTPSLRLMHASLRIIGPQDRPPSSITIIDDDTMLRSLREMGRPTGIIRSGGRVTLTQSFWPEVEEPDRGDSTG